MTYSQFRYVLTLGIVFACSSASFAHGELDKAYKLFQKRADGVDNITSAKKIYERLIKDSHEKLEVRKEAMDKYARLAVFQGEVGRKIYNIKGKAASSIFSDCIKVSDYLSPSKIGSDTPEYTYWRALCIGLWADNNSNPLKLVSKMGRINELKNLVELGQKQYKKFDGYGFNRMEAGMYVRSKGLTVLNLYHPERSLSLIDESIAQGTDVYMSYVLKAEALIALNRSNDAKATLKSAIEDLTRRLKQSDIPVDWVAENKIFLQKMEKMYRNIK